MMFSLAVKFKLISHHAFDLCEDSYDDMNEALDEERSCPIGSAIWDWLCEVRAGTTCPQSYGLR